ncbi:monocarboxylate transporter 6 isoform X1 [Equus quagga]|uniref:monocarboxylate transporter 6 isoform X1 n=2 Tax=Equus quagga TaxID=89248 RepID=UPI001EE2FD57|nr:monocarboxylate transporter 6 isoform X1 [Equus quagga]
MQINPQSRGSPLLPRAAGRPRPSEERAKLRGEALALAPPRRAAPSHLRARPPFSTSRRFRGGPAHRRLRPAPPRARLSAWSPPPPGPASCRLHRGWPGLQEAALCGSGAVPPPGLCDPAVIVTHGSQYKGKTTSLPGRRWNQSPQPHLFLPCLSLWNGPACQEALSPLVLGLPAPWRTQVAQAVVAVAVRPWQQHSLQRMPQALERPEGCWAWVVLLACLVTHGLTLGFPTCIGIFFTDLQHEFQASNSETSWFPSIQIAVLHAGGPLCSILVGCFGCRLTMMLGGMLACLGMVASSFCGTLGQLYVTAGFITGLGMCFSFQASITVLGFYFTRRRALANALASMGVSLGIMLWPLLSGYLLEDLGWRGTFLIFGGVFLHCCVCGAIVRPVATSMAPETKEGSPPPSKTPAPSCLAACGRAIQRHLAFDILWHNAVYRMYTLGVMWMIVGFPLPHVFLVPYAIRHGVDEHRAALLISIIGFCNIFLRPMAGLAAGRRDFADHRKYLFSLAALLNGLTNLVCTVSADFRVLVGYCLVYSVSMSGIGALLFQVLMDTVPMDQFSRALGLFTILESISILVSPPLAGFFLDISDNNFSYVFYMSSFFLISSALFMGGSFCALQKKERQGRQAEGERTITEAALEQALNVEGTDASEKRLYTEIMYVTSL